MSIASVRLGDVATFVRGITFKPADVLEEASPTAVGCMRTKNVQVELDDTDVWYLPENFVTNKAKFLQKGDLLVSTANSWNLVGKACWVPELPYACTFGGFISVLRAKDSRLDKRYLYHWFTSKQIQQTLRSFGNKTTNISNLSTKRAYELSIPLPPLAEQKRIAAILDKAEDIRRKREQVIEKLDQLAQSTFVEMFVTNESSEAVTRPVKEICEFKYGKSLPASKREPGAYNVYGSNGIVGTHTTHLSSGETIVIGRKGSYGEITYSKQACYPIDTTFYVDSTATEQNILWLSFALGTLKLNTMNKSAAVPGLSREDVYRQTLKVPKSNSQVDFEMKINAIDSLKSRAKSQLEQINIAFLSLQHQAFTTGFGT